MILFLFIYLAQAIKVNKDGGEATNLEIFQVTSYLECIKLCLDNLKCRFIVKSDKFCFLKPTTPASSTCAINDECAVVLGNFNKLIK